MSTLGKPISLSMIIRMYIANGSTTCYDVFPMRSRKEVNVDCDAPNVQPTVELRCIAQTLRKADGTLPDGAHFSQLDSVYQPFWDCAHHKNQEKEKERTKEIEEGVYFLLDSTNCNNLPVPKDACVTTTAPCLYVNPQELNVNPSGLPQEYQLSSESGKRTATIIYPYWAKDEIQLEEDKRIQLRSLDGTQCMIYYEKPDVSGRWVIAVMDSRDVKIEPFKGKSLPAPELPIVN